MSHSLPIALSHRELLLKTAERRLNPSLCDPNFLVLRARKSIFKKWIADSGTSELSVLDVGGRYQPYRPLLGAKVQRYFACDILQTDLVNVVGSGEALPFAAESFDLVIATQVFDYFAEPREAAKQIHAVLRPGGRLLMSVPSIAPRFSDQEYWRFTPRSIRSVLSDFSHVEIVPELSSAGGLCRLLNLAVHDFAHFHLLQWIARSLGCPLVNLIGIALESLRLTADDHFAPNYSVLATK